MATSSAECGISSHVGTLRHLRLTVSERLGLIVFFLLVPIFAGAVEFRSAFLSRRMGDLDCFLRAAWAVRTGADLYSVTDNGGVHYNYPPLLAILMAPLADPPAGADSAGMLPYPIAVAICFVLNLILLGIAVHCLARALEETSAEPAPTGSRGWWALRVWPIWACAVPVGHTLMRGQANLLVLAVLCASLACSLRNRRFQAGFWLAGAACLKIFPAFLVIFYLWRRDGRALLGWATGLIAGLIVIPVAVMGPARTIHAYERLTEVLILPGIGAGNDTSRFDELTSIAAAVDSQSLLVVGHRTLYPENARPAQASRELRIVAGAVGLLLTLVTLGAFGWRPNHDPVRLALLFGCLIINMLLVCPVCHLHYFSLSIPLIMTLLFAHWQGRDALYPGIGLTLLLALNIIGNLLPQFPAFYQMRDYGLAMYTAIVLWLAALRVLCKTGAAGFVSVTPRITPEMNPGSAKNGPADSIIRKSW